eukprot:scaffold140985_cov45-Prasinocladus_malaysianus.AAC.1
MDWNAWFDGIERNAVQWNASSRIMRWPLLGILTISTAVHPRSICEGGRAGAPPGSCRPPRPDSNCHGDPVTRPPTNILWCYVVDWWSRVGNVATMAVFRCVAVKT